MKRTTCILMSFLFASFLSFAQKPGVVTSKEPGGHKIGQVTASFKMETESIVAMGADVFKSIKLKVKDAPINLELLQVYYESGEMEDIPVKSTLQAGEETRVIDIKQKDIKKVSFTYKTLPNSGKDKADVELWGLK
jgi:hypothetical protein